MLARIVRFVVVIAAASYAFGTLHLAGAHAASLCVLLLSALASDWVFK